MIGFVFLLESFFSCFLQYFIIILRELHHWGLLLVMMMPSGKWCEKFTNYLQKGPDWLKALRKGPQKAQLRLKASFKNKEQQYLQYSLSCLHVSFNILGDGSDGNETKIATNFVAVGIWMEGIPPAYNNSEMRRGNALYFLRIQAEI